MRRPTYRQVNVLYQNTMHSCVKYRTPKSMLWWSGRQENKSQGVLCLRFRVLTALSTCEWSFSSPGTPWLRRSELPCRAAPQHSPPAGYTHADNPTGSHMSWTQWWCRKEVPVCTPLGTNIKFTMNVSEYQWIFRFCPLGQFIPPQGGNMGLTERMSSAWNWLIEKFNFLLRALAS